jgi:proteasome lid subunit RPN8/RPN11
MADRLTLSAHVHAALRAEAERARPAECCGLLAGRDERVTAIVPVPNAVANRVARYEMDPAELWAARRRIRDEGLDVVGFYHSHPRTAPVPSSSDLDRAYYPDAAYAIVGLAPHFEVRAYRISNARAREIVVEVED